MREIVFVESNLDRYLRFAAEYEAKGEPHWVEFWMAKAEAQEAWDKWHDAGAPWGGSGAAAELDRKADRLHAEACKRVDELYEASCRAMFSSQYQWAR